MARSFAVSLGLLVRSTTAPPVLLSLSFSTVWSFCLNPNWARCKNMPRIGLHLLTTCVIPPANFLCRWFSRCVSVVTLSTSGDLSGRLPAERSLL